MTHTAYYHSPLGSIFLAATDQALTGLWFEGQKYFAQGLPPLCPKKENAVLKDTKHWLDMYFQGKEPNFKVPVSLVGTAFQTAVWEILQQIPYGTLLTYKDIAQQLAAQRRLARMSAQAVGNAVGRNPISIIIPCHRVIGSNKSLTGYAGGIDKKVKLLQLEGIATKELFLPKIKRRT